MPKYKELESSIYLITGVQFAEAAYRDVRELIFDESSNVRDDAFRVARQAPQLLVFWAATPSTLVPAQDLNTSVGKLRTKRIVDVDVIAEAVHNNEPGPNGASWLLTYVRRKNQDRRRPCQIQRPTVQVRVYNSSPLRTIVLSLTVDIVNWV